MRAGAEYFLEPTEPAQRRYEALRAYVVEEAPAAEVGERFGYTPATVHQMAAELRAGKVSFFASSKPGPKGPRKAGTIRGAGPGTARRRPLGERDCRGAARRGDAGVGPDRVVHPRRRRSRAPPPPRPHRPGGRRPGPRR
jgi:hypothetical protein